jgi:hypothetical protein
MMKLSPLHSALAEGGKNATVTAVTVRLVTPVC